MVAGRALVLGGVALAAWWWSSAMPMPATSYRTAKIERGPLTAAVSSSGTVNPVTQVSVGSQVSGQIKEMRADFNTEVKQGQLIAPHRPGELRVQGAPGQCRPRVGARRGAQCAGQRRRGDGRRVQGAAGRRQRAARRAAQAGPAGAELHLAGRLRQRAQHRGHAGRVAEGRAGAGRRGACPGGQRAGGGASSARRRWRRPRSTWSAPRSARRWTAW